MNNPTDWEKCKLSDKGTMMRKPGGYPYLVPIKNMKNISKPKESEKVPENQYTNLKPSQAKSDHPGRNEGSQRGLNGRPLSVDAEARKDKGSNRLRV